MEDKAVSSGISNAGIKTIAYTTMFIDHFASIIVKAALEERGIDSSDSILLDVMNIIGRIAFPLFCFMLIEGMSKSSNKIKYLIRLFIMAIISEPCFDYGLRGTFWDPEHQNVCITLFIGGCMLWLNELYGEKIRQQLIRWTLVVVTVVAAAAASYLLKTDYSLVGITLIVVIQYIAPRLDRDFSMCIVIMALEIYLAYFVKYFIKYPTHRQNGLDIMFYLKTAVTLQLYEPVSLFIILFYNRQKGRGLHKLVYYSFYPLHLLGLGILAKLLF